ncbi:unnamed protein product [Ectocarpus fasciculatus]
MNMKKLDDETEEFQRECFSSCDGPCLLSTIAASFSAKACILERLDRAVLCCTLCVERSGFWCILCCFRRCQFRSGSAARRNAWLVGSGFGFLFLKAQLLKFSVQSSTEPTPMYVRLRPEKKG